MTSDPDSTRLGPQTAEAGAAADGDLFEAPVAEIRPQRRACLRCRTEFESAWAGERICARCKGSVAWRQGVPYRSNSPERER